MLFPLWHETCVYKGNNKKESNNENIIKDMGKALRSDHLRRGRRIPDSKKFLDGEKAGPEACYSDSPEDHEGIRPFKAFRSRAKPQVKRMAWGHERSQKEN